MLGGGIAYSTMKDGVTLTDLFSLSLADITPQNISQDAQISSLISAIDPELQELSSLSLEPLIMARIDELPEQLLDLLAWQLHADFYDLAGTLSMKREAVKSSILWHMHKGTQWAIMEALRQIDIKAEFIPWWQDNSAPYTFKLKAVVSGDFYRTKGRDKLIASIRRAVNESKAARSYLAGLETRIEFREDIGLYAGAVPFLSGEKRILPAHPESPSDTHIYTGVLSHKQGHGIVRLNREREVYAKVYAGTITTEYIDENIGVDLETMQELLRQFEKRIFERIDASEVKMLGMINAHHEETNAKLEEIKNMLLWKDDDEEI